MKRFWRAALLFAVSYLVFWFNSLHMGLTNWDHWLETLAPYKYTKFTWWLIDIHHDHWWPFELAGLLSLAAVFTMFYWTLDRPITGLRRRHKVKK